MSCASGGACFISVVQHVKFEVGVLEQSTIMAGDSFVLSFLRLPSCAARQSQREDRWSFAVAWTIKPQKVCNL
jgi:hypothetical protein